MLLIGKRDEDSLRLVLRDGAENKNHYIQIEWVGRKSAYLGDVWPLLIWIERWKMSVCGNNGAGGRVDGK